MRRVEFKNGHFYHIYNRGIDMRNIFNDKWDYVRFIRGMREFNDIENSGSIYFQDFKNKTVCKGAKLPIGSLAPKQAIVKIICYTLLPNHYHLLLKQLIDNGITKFMHKLGSGYANFINFKQKRTGSLFQGTYKSIEIKTDSYLQYLACYINGNAEIHGIARADGWPWSSFLDYAGKRNGTLCEKNIILSEFNNITDYIDYTNTVIAESKSRKDDIKNYFLE